MGTGNDALLVSVMEAARLTGMSRSGVYRCLASGDLRARKIGRTTRVETSSIRAFVDGLPEAQFREVPRLAA